MRLSRGMLCAIFVVLAAAVCNAAPAVATTQVASDPSESLSGGLLVSGANLFMEGQSQAAEEARRVNPEAIAVRGASETAYHGLGAEAAEKLAGEAFPSLIYHQDGGPPSLPGGERVVSFPSDFAATLSLPEGKHGVIDSPSPIAVDTSSGRVPIDLTPRAVGSGFDASTPAAGMRLRLGGRLSEGASLANLGVTLTPVTDAGTPLEATGRIDGASVFYGKSEDPNAGVTDIDSLIKPGTYGFSEETILRSQNSPQKLYFRVGLPKGASLVQAQQGLGYADVVAGGQTIAEISAPAGHDAEGTTVPLSLAVSGSTLILTAQHQSGQYRFPIEIDPTVEDPTLWLNGNWAYARNGSAFDFGSEEIGSKTYNLFLGTDLIGFEYSYTTGQYGLMEYPTQKESRIYKFSAKTSSGYGYTPGLGSSLVGRVYIENKGVLENVGGKPVYLPSSGEATNTLCVKELCTVPSVAEGKENGAFIEVYAEANSKGAHGVELKSSSAVYIAQEKGPAASLDTADATLEGQTNAAHGGWLNTKSPGSAVIGVNAFDPGIGIYKEGISSPSRTGWGFTPKNMSQNACAGVQCDECYEGECAATKAHGKQITFPFVETGELPDGEDTVEAKVEDAAGLKATATGTIKVDNTSPHNIVLSGLPSNNEISFGAYTLKAEASDGSTQPSSGIKSIGLKIDGHEVGVASGSCSPGPCTANSASWTINGHEFAAGHHLLVVTALDNAGNAEAEDIEVTVRAANPVSLGPGEVNPESGEFDLRATDVSEGEGLEVARSYRSEHLGAGAGGPLGVQWAIGMGSMESLEPQPEGGVLLTDDSGQQVIFASNGSGGFVSPPGDSNLSLSLHTGSPNEYVLSNAAKGTSTRFTLPSGGGSLWEPTVQEGTLATETTTYSYETVEISGKKITRPNEALAPVPSGVSCSPELKRGCRALTFNYASTTTATGESESQWGDYKGNLTRVYITAYDPGTSSMVTKTIAQYSYDSKGRLRAEWDPQVSPALKTFYGYDSENHLTAFTPPGQETYAFTYAQAPTDWTSGRIQRVTRAPASATLWSGSAPANTAAPVFTPEAPALGVLTSVSTGTWSGSPVAYRYQWQRCNASGGECVAIAEARNEAYKPTIADAGHDLRVEVQATSGGGSTIAFSAAKAVIKTGVPSYSAIFGSWGSEPKQFKWPRGVALDSSGNVWVADSNNNRVQELSASGSMIYEFGTVGTGNRQFKEDVGIAVTPEGNLWVTDAGNHRLQEFSSSGTYLRQFGGEGSEPGKFGEAAGITVTPEGNIWVADPQLYRIQEFSSTGTFIRQVNKVGSGNGELKKPNGIASDAYGDVWVADSGNNRVQEFSPTGSYIRQFGSEGTTAGKFKEPVGITVDSTGEIWVTDYQNNRIEGFNAAGEYLDEYGSGGSGNGQFSGPAGLAVSGSGLVYVVERGNSRVQELTLSSASVSFVKKFASKGSEPGQLNWPKGAAVDSSGNVWVADTNNNRIEKFTASGTFSKQFGTVGSGNGQLKEPTGIAITGEGNLMVSERGNHRVQEFDTAGNYIMKFGIEGSGEGQFGEAASITLTPEGNIWVADPQLYRIQEFTAAGTFIRQVNKVGSGNGELNRPSGIASDSHGDVWVTDTGNNRVQEFSPTGAYLSQLGSSGTGRGQFKEPVGIVVDGGGNVWVTDILNGRIEVFSPSGEYLGQYGVYGFEDGQFYYPYAIAMSKAGAIYVVDSGNSRVQQVTVPLSSSEPASPPRTEGGAMTTIEYNVLVSGAGAPYAVGSSEVAKWGQSDDPIAGMAIFPPDKPEGWPAPESAYSRATVYYFDEKGHTVNVASPTGGISTTEYNATNDVVRTLSADNRASALAEGAKSAEVSHALDSQMTYNSEGTELLSTLGPRHIVKLGNGEEVSARANTVYSYDEGAPSGGPFRLVTKVTEGAQIEGKPETDVRTTTTSYSGQENLGWTLRKPTSVMTDPSGLKLTTTFVYDSASGNVVEARSPASGGEGNPHDTKTIYYTNAANEVYPSCGGHPEWANLACEKLPGAQPETSGIPNLPITTTTYNYWLEPQTTTQTVGSDSRTTTKTYDEVGRVTKSTISSTIGTALPEIKNEYDSKTGALVKRSTTVEGTTTSLTGVYNTLGQQTSYTDADGTSSSFEYDIDGRTTFVNDGKGTQTYSYDAATGLLTELVDSAAGTFTSSYDVEGNMLTEKAPNKLTAGYAYNAVGEATKLEYKKTSFCGVSCTWFSQTEASSIHGQTLSQSNTLAQGAYKYDEAGRLTQVNETPTGQGCLTRVYSYDAETNRTGLTSREPGAEGKCATEGGTLASHSYDSGNRLTDGGIKYDSFGDTTVLPAADAGGSELTSTFYSDSKLASLTQAGETISYRTDPSRRTRETVSTGTTSSTVVSHYSDGGDSPSWTVDLSAKWTRYISGVGGGLAAIQYNGETPIMQVSDLEGNIVATASRSTEATALLSTTRSTEYGVPTTGSPPKYSWLGADRRPTELPSGVVAMGVRGYVPQLGRFLQTDPVSGGSANAYAYTFGDPVNTNDVTGEYTAEVSEWAGEGAQRVGEEERIAREEAELAREEAAREEAERKAEEVAEVYAAAAEATAIQVSLRRSGSGGHKPAREARHAGGATASYLSTGTKIGRCDHQCRVEVAEKKKKERKEREEEKAQQEQRRREAAKAAAAAAAEAAWQLKECMHDAC